MAVLGVAVVGLLVAFGSVLTSSRDGSGSREDERAGGTGPTSTAPTSTAPTSTSVVDRGGDVLVFLDGGITEPQRHSIEARLDGHPQIASYEYWDHAASLAEARRLFRDNAEMLARIDDNPDLIPASYRVLLTSVDPESSGRVAADAETWPGVAEATEVPNP